VPPYLLRSSANFIPTEQADYGDGGAFPEIHIVQYPLQMGQPGVKSTAVIAVNVDEKGQVSYDALVKMGGNKNKLVQTSLEDIKEKTATKEAIAMPDENEEQATIDRTRVALEALLDSKIKSSKPSTIVQRNEPEEPTYIRYTPNPNAPGYVTTLKI
jgi:SNW domain-containing protein 1